MSTHHIAAPAAPHRQSVSAARDRRRSNGVYPDPELEEIGLVVGHALLKHPIQQAC